MAEKMANDLLPFWKEQYQKGRIALDKKNYDYAIMLFNQLLDKEPGCVECRQALRITQFRKSEEGGSKGFFKKAFSMSGGLTHLSKAKMLMKSNPGEAMSALEKVLNDDPNNVSAHHLMADTALSVDYVKTALISLELLFNKLGQRDMATARKLADTYAKVGQPGKAEEIYEQLVRENPGDLELMQALKDVSASRTMKEGGYETAVETNDFRAALKDRAESDRLEKENRLVQTAASSASIIEDLEAKVQAEPNNMRWWRALADQYSHAKDYDKALNAYETLEKLFPGTDPQLAMRIISIKLKKVDELSILKIIIFYLFFFIKLTIN